MLDWMNLVFGFLRKRVSYVAMVFMFVLAWFYLVSNSDFESKTQAVMIAMVLGPLYFVVSEAMRADLKRDKNSK